MLGVEGDNIGMHREHEQITGKLNPKLKGQKAENEVTQVKEHSMFSTVDSHKKQPVPTFEGLPRLFETTPHFIPQSFYNSLNQTARFHSSRNDEHDLYVQDFSCGGIPFKGKLIDKKTKKAPVRKCHPVDDVSKYAIDVTSIPENKTTVMIKNIPNRYKKDTMLEMIDQEFKDKYDFFYL